MKNVLSIAGSDSSGGAGIQADLKTFCAIGVYGMSAITAITAQNTREVTDSADIPAPLVAAQINAVFDDIRVDAVKVGMVSSQAIIHTIGDSLTRYGAHNLVVDPVMVSKTGFPLLKEDAREAVKCLCAIADIVTPNIPEAAILAGAPVESVSDMRAAARAIAGLGAKNVLVKGGHANNSTNEAVDVLFCAATGQYVTLTAPRIDTPHTHGTGCTLSSAIAGYLALGYAVEEAARKAKAYLTQAIRDCYPLGHGRGPVGHLTALYRAAGRQSPEILIQKAVLQ
jgi:hydroxymethylpyrimidine/phosphomethylpyrimidine kinase